MHPVNFPESNLTIVDPKKLDPDGDSPFEGHNILDLHVFTDGTNVVSVWQLDEADFEELKRNGGKIYFNAITGCTAPPVWIGTTSPLLPEKDQYVTVEMVESLAENRNYQLEDLKEIFKQYPKPQDAWKVFWRLWARPEKITL